MHAPTATRVRHDARSAIANGLRGRHCGATQISASKGTPLPMEVKGRKDAYVGKLLVLIDGRTGSGGEIFAAAIQDTARGILIGRRPAGAILLGRESKLSQG